MSTSNIGRQGASEPDGSYVVSVESARWGYALFVRISLGSATELSTQVLRVQACWPVCTEP
jgi:hypothetical protein